MIKSKTYIATPPGATVKEQLQNRKMSQKEFAIRMDMSEKHISKFINGEVILTKDMAIRLEMVLGLPASFWNNLEAIYREKLQLAKEENEMDDDIELVKNFPYSEMSRNGWVKQTKDMTKKVFELRKFFEVVKLSLVKNPLILSIYRNLLVDKEINYTLLTWAQKAKIEARNIEIKQLDINRLKEITLDIKNMTKLNSDVSYPELISLLSSCGIALVLLPQSKELSFNGITFYDKDKIIIGLTVSEKDVDKFWPSLFQEIEHILIEYINNCELTKHKENLTDKSSLATLTLQIDNVF